MSHVIDNSLLKQSLLFCRFAAAAYSNIDPRNTIGLNTGQLSCDTRLPRADVENPTDTQALVCLWNTEDDQNKREKDKNNDLVVAFRGTEMNLKDIATDASGRLVQSNFSTGKVHKGFLGAMNFIYPYIMKSIANLSSGSQCRIFVTGHSLGGALAMLFAGRFVNEAQLKYGQLAGIFTYGAPRVGDREFVVAYRKSAAGNCTNQWVDKQDPVTHVAPVSMNYLHTMEKQLLVDSQGWVRRTNIDDEAGAFEKSANASESIEELIQKLRIVWRLDGESHRLEGAYLDRILLANGKS